MLLSPDNTRIIIESFLNKYQSQREAANMLNRAGFKAPEGGPVLQIHVYRAMTGSGLQLQDNTPNPAPEHEPIAPPGPEEPEDKSRTTIEEGWSEEDLGDPIPDSHNTFAGSFLRTFPMRGRTKY